MRPQILAVCLVMTLLVVAQTRVVSSDQPRSINPEDVLTKFVQVVGGPTASINSSITKAVVVDWDGRRIESERYCKSGKWLIVEHKGKTDVRRGFDGSTRWVQEGNGKPKRVNISYDHDNDVDIGDVLHWRDTFKKTTFFGQADVLGRKTNVIRVMGGRPASLYFDQETGLLVRRDTVWGQSAVEVFYSKYIDTSGVKMPWRTEFVHFRTGRTYITDFREVRTNVAIDDAIFEMPTH